MKSDDKKRTATIEEAMVNLCSLILSKQLKVNRIEVANWLSHLINLSISLVNNAGCDMATKLAAEEYLESVKDT